jgi:hypothetical protein
MPPEARSAPIVGPRIVRDRPLKLPQSIAPSPGMWEDDAVSPTSSPILGRSVRPPWSRRYGLWPTRRRHARGVHAHQPVCRGFPLADARARAQSPRSPLLYLRRRFIHQGQRPHQSGRTSRRTTVAAPDRPVPQPANAQSLPGAATPPRLDVVHPAPYASIASVGRGWPPAPAPP